LKGQKKEKGGKRRRKRKKREKGGDGFRGVEERGPGY